MTHLEILSILVAPTSTSRKRYAMLFTHRIWDRILLPLCFSLQMLRRQRSSRGLLHEIHRLLLHARPFCSFERRDRLA